MKSQQKKRAFVDILLVDDEPEYLDFAADYAETLGLTWDVVQDISGAFQTLELGKVGMILVDMSIPSSEAVPAAIRLQHPVVDTYPGIAVAVVARTRGMHAGSVFVYTVHDDDAIEEVLQKLDVRYLLKGRPEVLKEQIRAYAQRKGNARSHAGRGTPRRSAASGKARRKGS